MTRRFLYDTEFFERGSAYPIAFVSIGIVSEHGEEFYRVAEDAPYRDMFMNPWLRDNVLANLPGGPSPKTNWAPDTSHPAVADLDTIREDILAFLHPTEADPVELWAWYADYDHVVLSQLFGTMIMLPPGMPMYTHDLKQHVDVLDDLLGTDFNQTVRDLMHSEGTEHNALDDAKGVYRAFTGIQGLLRGRPFEWVDRPDTVTRTKNPGTTRDL